mmetsp:Transcript_71231/g.123693  ORF Transcript_71231/g.123693 Transcript_71231/m.123693 type:complete len:241 (+) Transcript_71231:45-767(+)
MSARSLIDESNPAPAQGPLRRMMSWGRSWFDVNDDDTVRLPDGRIVPASEAPPPQAAAEQAPEDEEVARHLASLTPQCNTCLGGVVCCGCLPCKPKKRRAKGYKGPKFECQYHIGIQQEPNFDVYSRIIGKAGKHMKDIVNKSKTYHTADEPEDGTRLRLRGQGSGFMEKESDGVKRESRDPMMLCVTSCNTEAFACARGEVEALLQGIYADYRSATRQTVQLHVHEGPRPQEGSRRKGT